MATTINSGRANSPKLTANIADHGTIYGGRGLIFDGVTDYLSLADSISLSGQFTISMWVYLDDNTSINLLGDSSSSANFMWIDANSDIQLASSDLSITFTDSNMTTSSWQNILVTRDGSNVPKFYNNGALIQTLSADAGTFSFNQIGTYHTGSNFFNGKMSDVKVFDTALTEAQVQELYLKPEQSAPSAVQDNLVAWYPLCEGGVESPQSIVYDHSEKGSGTQKLLNPTFDGDLTFWLTSGSNSTQSYNSDTGHYRQVVSANDGWWSFHWNQVHTFSDFGLFEAKVHFVSGNPYQVKFQLRDAGGTYHNKYSPELSSVGDSYHFKYYINGLGNYGDQRFYLTNAENGDTADWEFVKFTPVLMGNHATTKFYGEELVGDPSFDTGGSANITGLASGASVSSGKLVFAHGSGSPNVILKKSSNNILTSGNQYKITFTIANASDDGTYGTDNIARINFSMFSGSDHADYANGTHSVEGTADATTADFNISTASHSFEMTDVSIKQLGVMSTGFATADSEPTIPQVPLLRYNEKMVFDGVDDECSMGLGASAFGTGDQTLSAWFNASDLTGVQAIFGAMHYNASSSFGHGIILDGTTLHGTAGEGASTVYDNLTSGTLSVGKTYHTVFVRDATNDYYYLYVNGALVDSYSSSINPRFNDTYDNWMMGRAGNASEKGKYFQGTIDECSVFNTALSSTEIQELFSDGVALDATTHSKAGNLMGYWRNDGISSWTDRRGWSYLNFDGVNDFIQLPTPFSYTNHSISVWVNHSGINEVLFSAQDSSSYGIRLFIDDGNRLQYKINSSEALVTTAYANQWVHFVCTYDGSTMRVYANGVQVQTNSVSESVDTTTNARIGATSFENGSYFEGSISSVGFYNVTKSASEILAIYNDGLTGNESTNSGLIGYWKLDNGTTVNDLSSNSNNGTVSGATLNTGNNGTPAGTPEAITIREGLNSNKDGLGYSFKNDDKNVLRISQGDDYVRVNKSIGNLLGDSCQAFSYECWFKVPDTNIDDGIITFADDLSSAGTGVGIRISANRIVWTFKLDGSYENVYNGFTSTEWNYVAVVYDGSNYANTKLYLNGSAVQTAGSSGFPSSQNFANTYFYIGLYYQLTMSGLKGGMIDEVRVYNKTLSATEVLKNYKHQKGKHK